MITQHPHEANLWVDQCEEPNCYWSVAVHTPFPAGHKCPWAGGITKIAWSVTVTLVDQMWHRLDSIMDELALLPAIEEPRENDPNNSVSWLSDYIGAREFEANLKGKARGMAEMIAIFMQPHFNDANEVAREAKRRAEARARKDTEYETAGLNSRRFEGPKGDLDKYKVNPAKKSKALSKVSAEDAAKIERAYETFPKDMLAKTFKVSEAEIDEIVAEVRREAGAAPVS